MTSHCAKSHDRAARPLEALCGGTITSISYPHGAADSRVATAARRAGYASGFSGERRAASSSTDELRIGRIVPSFTSVWHLALRLVYAIGAAMLAEVRGESGTGQVATSRTRAPGLVMLCDVDLGFPDATRTHTVEVARGFALAGLDVDLVTRGPGSVLEGVRYSPAQGSDAQRSVRVWTITLRTVGLLWRRRRTARRFYVRDKWSCTPSMVAARAFGYRVVTQVDALPFQAGSSGLRLVVDRLRASAMGRLSHGILAVTPEINGRSSNARGIPAEQIVVVRNGVDTEFFTPTPRDEAIARTGLDPANRYAIFCGGFHLKTFDSPLITAKAPPAQQLFSRQASRFRKTVRLPVFENSKVKSTSHFRPRLGGQRSAQVTLPGRAGRR